MGSNSWLRPEPAPPVGFADHASYVAQAVAGLLIGGFWGLVAFRAAYACARAVGLRDVLPEEPFGDGWWQWRRL
ncbi:hypothetical protein DL766_005531 [Monosporascus sp. MC13-8B]|uniref:Uncharacterized protein n=1 Tax=Monosporascus cannonballus TaxID=155416 RepID=A0ABY0H2A8_9PEZI|nr:hypothetical protein DL763_009197 [Monosporascus cannonballus]RYO83017.1 hypothetical protein DL762_006352 [Monosporascus cannonballus]RYP29086.1 hypothetical protein DL766_005531 [Monosporascus sp. MC13-8B]